MSNSPSASKPATTKPRSPVERIVVWGLIALLLVVVGLEASAKFSYQKAIDALEAKIEDSVGGNKTALKEADVKAVLGSRQPASTEDLTGKNIANAARRVDIYKWFTVNPYKPRALFVYYGPGKDPDLIAARIERELSIDEKYPVPKDDQRAKADSGSATTPTMPSAPGSVAGPPGMSGAIEPPVLPDSNKRFEKEEGADKEENAPEEKKPGKDDAEEKPAEKPEE
jgi:hypothetical protein